MNIWDTAGQERYNSLTKMYFKGAHAALVVYDITDRTSFDKARDWLKELNMSMSSENKDIEVFLVGNKIDCVGEQEVSLQQNHELAEKIGATGFEVSAKDNIGIEEMFKELAIKLNEKEYKEREVELLNRKNGKGEQNNSIKLRTGNQGEDQNNPCQC